MTATDELRRLLDERGVEWWEGADERKTHWESSGLTWEYFNDENGDAWLGFLGVCESDVSPEQAIAATLGSDASAVRLAERLRSIADEMRSVGASSMTPHELLACYASDVDKVADSLMFAATLGSGTCHLHYGEDDDGYDGWYCDECGGWFQAVRRDGRLVKPKHCQECGRRTDDR